MNRKVSRLTTNRGSIFLELLLGLFIWTIIIGLCLPNYLKLQADRRVTLIEYHAVKIVNEQVIKALYQEPFEQFTIGDKGTEYQVFLKDNKVCVEFQTWKEGDKHICRKLSQRQSGDDFN